MAPTIPAPPALLILRPLQYLLHRRLKLPKERDILRPLFAAQLAVPRLDLARLIETIASINGARLAAKAENPASLRLWRFAQLKIQKRDWISVEAVGLIKISFPRDSVKSNGWFATERPRFDTGKDKMASPRRAMARHQEPGHHYAWCWGQCGSRRGLGKISSCIF